MEQDLNGRYCSGIGGWGKGPYEVCDSWALVEELEHWN